MSGPPAEFLEALERLADEARSRYGLPLVRVRAEGELLIGSVGVEGQLRELDDLRRRLWPKGRTRVLVLATRRARVGLWPDGAPLRLWRRPPRPREPRSELTTELLPGDPPGELVAAFPGLWLVRAPGEAVGWVERGAGLRIGPLATPAPGPVAVGPRGAVPPWSREAVLGAALSQLGRPYVWGGTGSAGMDCSGLLWRSFLAAGLILPRNSRAQRLMGRRVRRGEIAPGDVVAAISRGPRRLSHVALAVSGTEVVHACSERMAVRREPLQEFELRYRVVTVRRLPGADRSSR